MAQSLARIHVHLVFSTKGREPLLEDSLRDSLHDYMAATLRESGCLANAVNSVSDHVHILFELGRTIALADSVQRLKKQSSIWLRARLSSPQEFHWQIGYSAFSVSASKRAAVARYIRDQARHHIGQSYQDEVRMWLGQYQMPFDERYIWD